MTTFTMSQLASNAKAVHTGMIVTGSALSIAVTATAASVFLLSKVPNGATLIDFWLRVQTGGASQTIKIGTSASPSGIMQITSLSLTQSHSATPILPVVYGVFNQGWLRAPGGTTGGVTGDFMPVHISLSDDLQPAEVWIQAENGVGVSDSAFLTWCLFYTMDGLTGHTTIR